MTKPVLKALRYLFDAIMTALVLPSALVMYVYRRIGSARLPLSTAILRRVGVFPIRNHYYEPLFDPTHLDRPLNAPRHLPGIDFRIQAQLEALKTLSYAKEFEEFLRAQKEIPGDISFRLENQSFGPGDADFLFQIIRWQKPGKVIEIGSGSSTKVAKHALELNSNEGSNAAEHICVEPYEQPWLDRLENITVVRSKIEDYDLDWGTELRAGDLLFIDSSHMIRPQGDVLHEYLSILPQLATGVLVHVHDIFSPRDYLRRWLEDDVKFWNEQYLLEAILSNSARYEIVAALNLLKHEHFEDLKLVCPTLTDIDEPGSLYFRVR